MIRIVGLQKSDNACEEFLLLQNQGALKVTLKGHALMAENAVQASDFSLGSYVFSDAEVVRPGQFVILITGRGENHWGYSTNGVPVYFCFMNREVHVWSQLGCSIHVLQVQHTFTERVELSFA